MRFTKLDLLESFDRLDKSYRLSILCSYWIRDVPCFQPNAAGLALETEMKAGNDWIKFDDLGISLQTRATAESLSAELMLNQLHTLIRISFELLVDYCKCYDKLYPTQQNDLQFAKMRQMDWFNFAKIVRNAISHNFHFALKSFNSKLPVSWGGASIDITYEGEPITGETLWHNQGYALFLEMQRFAESLP